jgi:hypothetical protein
MLFTFPFVFFIRKKPKAQGDAQKKRDKKDQEKTSGENPVSGGETYGENGPYGIN